MTRRTVLAVAALAALTILGFVVTRPSSSGARARGNRAGSNAPCATSCAGASACLLAPADCVARCTASPALARCLALADDDCARAATCGFEVVCEGKVPSGASSCLTAMRCQSTCAKGDLACGCACSAQMSPTHTLALAKVDTCAMSCEYEQACIEARCPVVIRACAIE